MATPTLKLALHMPISESYSIHKQVDNLKDATFMVRSDEDTSNPIIFKKFEAQPHLSNSDEGAKAALEFSRFSLQSQQIMEKMSYSLTAKQWLNFNRGLRVLLIPIIPKGEVFNYYKRTKRGLRYISLEAEAQT